MNQTQASVSLEKLCEQAEVVIARYVATYDPIVNWASGPWSVEIHIRDGPIFKARGATEGEAMVEAFKLIARGES